MLKRKDFVSSRNYFLISLLHYGLKPFYFISRFFISRNSSNNRIVFIELGHLGDMLTTASAIRLTRLRRPDSKIICICSSSGVGAIRNNPMVDEICVIDTPSWYGSRKDPKINFVSSCKSFFRALKKINAGTVINIRATSYHIDHVLTWLSGASERIGFGNKGLDYLLTFSGNASSSMPIPLKKLNLVADWLGVSPDIRAAEPMFSSEPGSDATADSILKSLGLENKIVIGINPGAQHNFLWPESYFVELCKMMRKNFQVEFLFFGTASQVTGIDQIRNALPFDTYSVAGKTGLDELFGLLKRTRILVTIDTGIRHLANAASIPVIAIRFGADGYQSYGKYAEKETVIMHHVPCAPCGHETCPLQETICITRITPFEIFEAASRALTGSDSIGKVGSLASK